MPVTGMVNIVELGIYNNYNHLVWHLCLETYYYSQVQVHCTTFFH